MNAFSDADSLGRKSPRTIAEYLRSVDDIEAAARFEGRGAAGQGITARILGIDQYAHTGMLVGFVEAGQVGTAIDVQNGLSLKADASIAKKRIKITLDKFYVQSYPGHGTHTVLCEFSGKNQVAKDTEELRFALSTQVNDKSSAGLSGAPIFLGVSVGKEGIAFEGRTVNVRSSLDNALVEALGSDTFRSGLSLLTSAQPALKPFVGLATSAVKAVANRTQNCQVFSFKLGLDFAGGATSVRLRLGSYVVVQADSDSWDWSSLVWNSDMQAIVNRKTNKQIEFNYMVFGVSA